MSESITVLGLGEAGRIYARGFAEEGAHVKGFDPFTDAREFGVDQFDDLAEALQGSRIVVSLVGANAAADVAALALPHLDPAAIYADLNTGSPAMKAEMAHSFENAGVSFVDVAVMGPVPRAGHRTTVIASGSGADALASLLAPLGTDIQSIAGNAGDAASRKLLRSVFMKGLAGLVLETVAAGDAAGQGEWTRNQIAAELGPNGEAVVERLITGTHEHAERRRHEMESVLNYLSELESPQWMTQATLAWISSLVSERTAL